ncbi:MAG: ABC transporter ATP-binding protein [Sphaerochaetaceae bacterium]|nr:ABC transporter ATP-binding protein [Sphaerochaetaceae bacterium]
MDYELECKDVTYTYPLAQKPAIKELNLKIEKGKLYGVIGENGSGKTTLCSILRGFAPSFYKGDLTGEILVQGKALASYKDQISRKIGYVFQNPFTQISGIKNTVFEEVAYGLENFGIDVEEIEKKVINIMQLTDIMELAEKSPFELSGGQMQRVALASVIVLEPEILIIDEPTSQLDPQSTESVFKIIKKLKEEKKTIILVEHKVDLLAEYSDEMIVLHDSKIIKQGESREVLSDLSLREYGIRLPEVTLLSEKLREAGLDIDQLPITKNQILDLIEKKRKGE